MSFTHGKNAYLAIDNASNSLTSIRAFLDEVTFPQNIDESETTTFGQGAKTYIAGLFSSKFTAKGKFDGANSATTQDTLINATIAAQQNGTLASVSVEYGPAGNAAASGNPKFTFEVILTSYEISAPVGDVVTFSLEGTVTGSVTRSTY